MKPYIIPFEQLKNKDVELVGGKNASIGEMISGLASLGVSVVRATFTNYEMLINEADAALYAAKRQGRNQVAALRIGA